MSLLTKFHYFLDLPVELQEMIWDFYRNQRGVRHYLTLLDNERFYACIDIDNNTFMNTYVNSNRVAQKANLRWPRHHPASGKEFEIVGLIGRHRIPEPGSFAKSINTTKDRERASWGKRRDLRIRIRLENDLVFVDAMDSWVCLRPLSSLGVGRFNLSLRYNHWFRSVRHLAIQLRALQSNLDIPSTAEIESLWKLENLYLVVYRDPQCVYGPPRHWRYFKKDFMDEYNFLPFETFNQLHPRHMDKECRCTKTANDAKQIQNLLREAIHDYRGFDDRGIVIKIVVDPY
ncbi:hypothetical protein F5Y06DRAFT_304491 [Hypoxylon sp. FL0890]|nr:hypothetical protein F5Y06DRAFT_304491 [Hypoxylon sp. FL0890]